MRVRPRDRDQSRGAAGRTGPPPRPDRLVPGAARAYAPAVAIIILQLIVYPLPAGVWLLGFVLGMLGSLVALGLALVQRANRVINFAQADLGTVPTAFAYGCITSSWALPWLLSFAIGLVGAVILGALVEFLLVRRFFKSSRLVLTVATIGISQLFLVGARACGRRRKHCSRPWRAGCCWKDSGVTRKHSPGE